VSSSPEPDRFKKAILYATLFVFVLLAVEATAQLLYWFRDALRPAATETFHVRSFTRLVADARHVTAIPNFSSPKRDEWQTSTDSFGFRGGAQTTNPDCPSVVIVGDSVPFGYGGPDRASMPSKLFEHLQKANDPRCVINAAIPSYSLFQAVARFEREIVGKFKTDALYLQIIDPALQFARFGAQWRPDIDWTTERTVVKQRSDKIASIAIVRDVLRHFEVLKAVDQDSLDRYRLEIRRELERLHDMAVQADVKQLVVAPVTVPASSYRQYPEQVQIAFDAINDEFSKFAGRHQDTTFLDTIKLLRSYPNDEIFLDRCCHLTERGNDVVAEQLTKILIRK
jgi:hypothetical protein